MKNKDSTDFSFKPGEVYYFTALLPGFVSVIVPLYSPINSHLADLEKLL
jgi:hypothetical protein